MPNLTERQRELVLGYYNLDEETWLSIPYAEREQLIADFRSSGSSQSTAANFAGEDDPVQASDLDDGTDSDRPDDEPSRSPQPDDGSAESEGGETEASLDAALAQLSPEQIMGLAGPAVTQILGGRPLSDVEAEEALRLYNQGARYPANTLAELFQRAAANDMEAVSAVAAVRMGETSDQVRVLVGTDPFNVTGAQYAYVGKADFVDTAASLGVEAYEYLPQVIAVSEASGKNVPWQILAPAAKGIGAFDFTATPSQLQPAPFETGDVELPGGATIDGEGADDLGSRSLQQGIAEQSRRIENRLVRRDQLAGINRDLSEQYERFGSWGLAVVALENQGLARAIYNRGYATADEAQLVRRIFDKSGLAAMRERLEQKGILSPEKMEALVGSQAGSQGNVTVDLPDPSAINESIRTLWRAWFQDDPTQAELDIFRGQIENMIRSEAEQARKATRGNVFKGIRPGTATVDSEDVNPEARLRDYARSQPEYEQLFGEMNPGQTEAEYVRQFESAGAALLGGQSASADAIRAGQATGDVQTTLGYVAASAEAEDNSTFRQRIAQAAEVINRMT